MTIGYKEHEIQRVSFKMMCEKIAESKILLNKDGSHPTAQQVFNYSPSGELGMIFGWYGQAKIALGEWTREEAIVNMFGSKFKEAIDGTKRQL